MEPSMELFLDYIGVFAPVILFIITLFLLRHMRYYLQFLLIGTVLNNMLNIILKLALQQPRPLKDNMALEIAISNGRRISFHKYGMPSGHAQNCGFFLGYVSFVMKDIVCTGFYLILSMLSLVQRVKYNNHTTLQVILGFIIGILVSYILYIYASKYIVGYLQAKLDDNAEV